MTPATRKIYSHVLDGILNGEFPVDAALPTEVALARRFNASRMSAHFAIKTLEDRGIVRRSKRRGSAVVHRPDAPAARDLKRVFANRVHVIASLEQPVPLHWNEKTLVEMEGVLAERGFDMVHLPPLKRLDREALREQLEAVGAEGSTALALLPDGHLSLFLQEHADLIFQYHRNVYLFDRGDTPVERWPFNVLSLDPFGEGVLAGEYLYGRGYRHAAFWDTAGPARYWAEERCRGLRFGLQRASDGRVQPEVWKFRVNQGSAEVCKRLRSTSHHMAVVAATDLRAAELIEHAKTLGLEPARDFGLISFDNDPRYRSFNLTTVAPPMERVGQMLGELVTGKSLPAGQHGTVTIKAPSTVVERRTCSDRMSAGLED